MPAGPDARNSAPAAASLEAEAAPPPSRFLIWLHRITVLLFVLLCASVGVLLLILPWRPEWTQNALLTGYPTLQAIVGSSFVRGLCSGFGILDIWIGFGEAVHYHEPKQF